MITDSIYTGRNQIFCSFNTNQRLTDEELIELLNRSLSSHLDNARQIKFLINYFKGEQEILSRVKEVRSDINNRIVFNYAMSTTRDIIGYTFGKPVQYTQRKQEGRESITLLNDYMEMEDKPAQDQELSTFCSICGVGYRAIFPNKVLNIEDDVPFEMITLNPQNTFVVYSYELGNGPVIGVTYTYDKNKDITTYWIYTNNESIIVKVTGEVGTAIKENIISRKPHLMGGIPIVEYINNQWRMGHWETAITVLNAINVLGSDSVNDVVQFVNSILVGINAEIDEEVMEDIQEHKIASIKSPQGLVADLKYISNQLDSNGVQVLRQYLEDSYKVIVGVPDRQSRKGGGDTGEAVKLRDGFQDMEIVARTTEMFFKRAEKKVLALILNVLKSDSNFKQISLKDIDIKFTRNKTDNLQSKVQAGATLNQMGLYDPVDITDLMDITTDPQEMVDRGKTYQDEKKKEEQEQQITLMKEQSKIQGVGNSTNNNRGNTTT